MTKTLKHLDSRMIWAIVSVKVRRSLLFVVMLVVTVAGLATLAAAS